MRKFESKEEIALAWKDVRLKQEVEADCKAIWALEELCAKCTWLAGKVTRSSGMFELARSVHAENNGRVAFVQYDNICAIHILSSQTNGNLLVLRELWQELGPNERVIVFCESDYHSLIKSITGTEKATSYIIRAWQG